MTSGTKPGCRLTEHASLVTKFVRESGTTERWEIIISGVTEKPTLSELIELASAKHNGASGRRLADIAADAGFDVSHTTLNRIRSGTYNGAPSATTIKAIAWLASVSEDHAFAAAGQDVPRAPFASVLPPGVDNLGPSERRAVVELLRVFTQYHQRDWERAQREWARINELAGNVATSLRAAAQLHEWTEQRLPADQHGEFEGLVVAVAQPLMDIANWYGQHAETLAHERNASLNARSEISDLSNAVAAVRHLHRGEPNDLETTTEPAASAEGHQNQEAGADDAADAESARPTGDHHPPSGAKSSAKPRRRDASEIQDRIPRSAKAGKRGKDTTGFDQ